MTTEEKAKAYDEALERMKYVVVVPKDKKALQALKETIFPELAESEDERIGNVIYCIIRDNKEVKRILDGNGVSVDNALAWLEKQKDSKVVKFDHDREQKPAEWSDEDYNALNYVHELISFGYTENFFDAQTAADMRSWLNSHITSWKPSEEQIDALERASTNKYLSAKQFDILVSLYEQLKKL